MFYNLKNCLSNIEINYTVKLLGLRNSLIRFKKNNILTSTLLYLKKNKKFYPHEFSKKKFSPSSFKIQTSLQSRLAQLKSCALYLS